MRTGHRESVVDAVRRTFLRLHPGLLFRFQHYKFHARRAKHRYWANPRRPRTFNEHIMARKLDPAYRHMGRFVDKAAVKGYVASLIPERHVISTYGVFRSIRDLQAAHLPVPCVIKPTHLSGQVIFVTDASDVTRDSNVRRVERWLRTNHYYRTGEPQYRDLTPAVIAEPFIGVDGHPPNDFKFFCWRGEPRILQVDSDRFSGHKRDFFDMHLRRIDVRINYPPAESVPTLPVNLDAMLDMCRKLSVNFDFARIDLYEVAGNIYFGEITLHPGSGNEPFGNYASDLELGSYFTAP
jgi:hypothetical protein